MIAARPFLAGLAGALLCVGILSNALGVPVRSGAVLARTAARALAAGRPEAAERAATRALLRAPITVVAIRTRGLALERQGRGADGARMMALAGALGWRDVPTQLWLIGNASAAGDLPGAVRHIDAVARRVTRLPQMFALLRAVAMLPGGAAVVAERLAVPSPWQSFYWRDFHALTAAQHDAQERVFAELERRGRRVTPAELSDYVTMLAERGAEARGRAVWTRFTRPPAERGAAVLDGGLDRIAAAADQPALAPFDWTLRSGADAQIEADPAFEPGASVLRLRADGVVAQPLLTQIVTLPPGTHRLTVRAATIAQGADDAFAWTVRCRPGGTVIRPQPPGPGVRHGRWTVTERPFVVPAAGCTAQTLELAAVAGGAGTSHVAWLDAVAIR